MKFWNNTDKKDDKSPPTNVRIDTEDMIEQNYTCKEIAEELGISEEQVYRIKNAKKRREHKIPASRPDEDGDTELKKLQIEIKKQELEQKKLQIQWDAEDRKTERLIKLKTLLGEYGDFDGEEGGGVIEKAITALASAWFAHQQTNLAPGADKGVSSTTPQPSSAPGVSLPAPGVSLPAPAPHSDGFIDRAIESIPDDVYFRIRDGKITHDQVIQYATGQLGVNAQEAEEAYKKIMEAQDE